MMRPGESATLTVVREASFGYFLSDGNEDVLLHKNDVTEAIAIDDSLSVFFISRPPKSIKCDDEDSCH